MKAPEKRASAPPKKDRLWGWLFLAAVICGAMLYWRQGQAGRLFDQAQAEFASHPERAEELLDRSVAAAWGDFPEAQLLRCRALGAIDRWDAALGLFSLIEEPSRCEQRGLLSLAQEAEQAGVAPLALMALEAADREGPQQAAVLKHRIVLGLQEGQRGEVLERCRRLEQLDSEDPFPWEAEGRILQQTKRPVGAIRAYREALKRKPSERQGLAIRVELVSQLVDAGELERARIEIDRLLANPATAEAVRVKDAYLLRLEGRTAEALDQINRVLAAAPDWAPGLMLRGLLYLDLERYGEAADDLGRAVAALPYNKEGRYKLAQAYAKLKQPEKAAREFEISRKQTEAEIEVHSLEAQWKRNRSDRELADRLVELYEQVGRSQDAERLLRSAAAD